jgi:hypothetical protein
MRIVLLLSAFAFACSREVPPRDYQNNPPAMTHPATSSTQTPAAHGMPGPAPEPSKGAEGKNITRQPTTATGATTTIKDTAPATTTTTTTGTIPP